MNHNKKAPIQQFLDDEIDLKQDDPFGRVAADSNYKDGIPPGLLGQWQFRAGTEEEIDQVLKKAHDLRADEGKKQDSPRKRIGKNAGYLIKTCLLKADEDLFQHMKQQELYREKWSKKNRRSRDFEQKAKKAKQCAATIYEVMVEFFGDHHKAAVKHGAPCKDRDEFDRAIKTTARTMLAISKEWEAANANFQHAATREHEIKTEARDRILEILTAIKIQSPKASANEIIKRVFGDFDHKTANKPSSAEAFLLATRIDPYNVTHRYFKFESDASSIFLTPRL